MEVYRYQFDSQSAYKTFSKHFLNENELPGSLADFPLMPIRAFKELSLIADGAEPELEFRSSGTGSMERSKHLLADPEIYKKSILMGFAEHFELSKSVLLCYAPGYSDNPDSSLLWMLNFLVEHSGDPQSAFLPLNRPLNQNLISSIENSGKKIILFGAAFGLLDLIEMGGIDLPKNTEIIETGGMKTFRREMTKAELREKLSEGFSIPQNQIHSEYGMCELLSQLYAIGGEWFEAPPWVHASVRDPHDPFRICNPGEEGKIGVIDLANVYSCSFILTEDRGVMDENGRLRVLGRWNATDLRGCNFLIDRD